MANQELIEYIQAQLEEGVKVESIKKLLLEKGWSEKEFDEALIDIIKLSVDQVNAPSTKTDFYSSTPSEKKDNIVEN